MRQFLFTLSFMSFALVSLAQTFEIKSNKDLLVIGEQTELTLSLIAANGSQMQLPLFTDTVAEHIEVVSASKIDTITDGSTTTLTQKLTITSFDSGYYAVSPRAAFVNNDTVWSNPFLIAVQTLDVDTNEQFYDIKNTAEFPISIKELLKEYWPWLAGALALFIIITIIVLQLSKGKKALPVLEKPKPKIPAHIAAIQRLEALKAQELWQKGDIKAYYSELTEILRWYIEQRFSVPALEQTTDEIKQSLQRLTDIETEDKEKVNRLLFLADLVKFAKEKPIGSENELHFEMTKLFVEQYAPKIENLKEDVA